MQKGFQNEIDFVRYFNYKKIKELSNNAEKLIYALFSNQVYSDSKIECWKSKYPEKADIKIRINGIIKGISIKSGHACSMHQENKENFYHFLVKIGLDNITIKKIDQFMLGIVDGQKVNTKTYAKYHHNDIQLINSYLNKYYTKINLILRFVIQGTEIQNYDCDALIHGTPECFMWATKDELLKYLGENLILTDQYLAVSKLNIKCYDRNLNNNVTRKKGENDIQVKWVTIIEDLQCIENERNNKILNN